MHLPLPPANVVYLEKSEGELGRYDSSQQWHQASFCLRPLRDDQHAQRTDDTGTFGCNNHITALACLLEELKGCPTPPLDATSPQSLVSGDGNRYNYDQVDYKGTSSHVVFTCSNTSRQ